MGALRVWHIVVLLLCLGGVAGAVALLAAVMRRNR